MTLSLRSRLLTILAGLLAVGLGLAAVVTVTAVRRDMISRIDETIRSVSRNPPSPVPMQPAQGAPGPGVVSTPPAGETPMSPPAGGDSGRSVAVVVFGRDGRPELSLPSGFGTKSDPLPKLPSDARDIATGVFLEAGPSRDPGPVYRILASRLPDGRTVVAAAPLSEVDAAVRSLALVWLVTGIALLAVLVAAGWWAIRAGMRPVDDMVETAGAIAAGDLTQRVDHTDPRSEVGRLGSAINVMPSARSVSVVSWRMPRTSCAPPSRSSPGTLSSTGPVLWRRRRSETARWRASSRSPTAWVGWSRTYFSWRVSTRAVRSGRRTSTSQGSAMRRSAISSPRPEGRLRTRAMVRSW
ncbi:MAG: HAMP domain-containing protein [Actinobacteria bacterium ATB1]|nr:HAMP domain-containing protein [Actinobacteria bacterium ATB1]